MILTSALSRLLESEGNGAEALIEPIVSAVSSCMRPEWTNRGLAWIEAFDRVPLTSILQTMRSLDLFSEQSLAHYLSLVLRNKLTAILNPAEAQFGNPRRAAVKKPGRPKRPADQPARMAA
jgi:hypothetical protein